MHFSYLCRVQVLPDNIGTYCAVLTCQSEPDEHALTFSLTDVFMITFYPVLPPHTHTLTPSCYLAISDSTCGQYLLGDFLISH